MPLSHTYRYFAGLQPSCCYSVSAKGAFGWIQEPNPLEEGHLAVIHPGSFVGAGGKAVVPARTAGALFNGATTVTAPVQAVTRIKADGDSCQSIFPDQHRLLFRYRDER